MLNITLNSSKHQTGHICLHICRNQPLAWPRPPVRSSELEKNHDQLVLFKRLKVCGTHTGNDINGSKLKICRRADGAGRPEPAISVLDVSRQVCSFGRWMDAEDLNWMSASQPSLSSSSSSAADDTLSPKRRYAAMSVYTRDIDDMSHFLIWTYVLANIVLNKKHTRFWWGIGFKKRAPVCCRRCCCVGQRERGDKHRLWMLEWWQLAERSLYIRRVWFCTVRFYCEHTL